MKKMIIALAFTASTALLAHESYYNDYSLHDIYREAPQKVICPQLRIVHVEPARVYYGWNDHRYDRDYYRGYERREHRYARREDRRDDHEGWRHEWHDDDDRHDRR